MGEPSKFAHWLGILSGFDKQDLPGLAVVGAGFTGCALFEGLLWGWIHGAAAGLAAAVATLLGAIVTFLIYWLIWKITRPGL